MKVESSHLVKLNECILKVLEVSLEGLRHLLPVCEAGFLDITPILQIPQLSFDPRFSLWAQQQYNSVLDRLIEV